MAALTASHEHGVAAPGPVGGNPAGGHATCLRRVGMRRSGPALPGRLRRLLRFGFGVAALQVRTALG
ncbi:hypothetical protein GCM10022222_60660 [Amycolatopsis ultiminotia]|uniref:Uncharacterized protein n=1 Tax=Amycolatopsis ultiminotia TaxID=543629 RepID=A0ABP6XPH2_9PSEU